jgi:hypothetical protein
MKVFLLACRFAGGFAAALAAPCCADTGAHQVPLQAVREDDPNQASCLTAVAAARELAERLPAGDASRYFAERDLQQAMTEAGNGEFDDCLERAEQATLEIKQHRHTLKPGETLNVRPAEK